MLAIGTLNTFRKCVLFVVIAHLPGVEGASWISHSDNQPFMLMYHEVQGVSEDVIWRLLLFSPYL